MSDEGGETKTPRGYRVLRGVARAAMRTFYSRVEATGLDHVDPRRPTIYAPTHPNSILDPVLVALFEDRPVRFIARDGLFSIPVMGQLLRAVGAIPIRRRSDHGDAGGNADAFEACREALKKGGVLVLFPEGKTHGRLRVEQLKTGLARIALDAKASDVDVQIIPIGLNYLVRHAFRSDVHVAFGEAIDAVEAVGEESDPREAVRRMTRFVQRRLEALTVHIEDQDDELLIAQVTSIVADIRLREGVDRTAQSPAERVALARRVVDAYRWLEETDPDRTAELRERITALLEERAALGLGGERPALQHRGERTVGRRWTDDPWLFALGAPIAAYGVANHIAPYLCLRAVLALSPPSFYRGALVRLAGGAGIFAAFYAGQTALVGSAGGPALGALYALSLLPSGLFARRYLAEARLHRFGPRRVVRMFRHRDRVADLRAEREALIEELTDLRRAYLDQAEELEQYA